MTKEELKVEFENEMKRDAYEDRKECSVYEKTMYDDYDYCFEELMSIETSEAIETVDKFLTKLSVYGHIVEYKDIR